MTPKSSGQIPHTVVDNYPPTRSLSTLHGTSTLYGIRMDRHEKIRLIAVRYIRTFVQLDKTIRLTSIDHTHIPRIILYQSTQF